ncbi:MAG: DUF5714 domain-containing protein [Methanocorpusculum sp.]|nr:DUF5714 domain-containing protein [Methanocorpusculum sp.]
MNFTIAKCKVCGEDMLQEFLPEETKCDVCGKDIVTNFTCSNGHHMCNQCRFEGVMDDIKRVCLNTASKNPLDITTEVMKTTELSLIGCKHYFLTAFSLYTAYKNAGGPVNDFEGTINRINDRLMTVQTSVCKLGCFCGIPAAIGGAFQTADIENKNISEITKTANILTGNCMAKLINPNWYGNSDCCIRNAIICVVEGVKFLKNYYSIDIELPNEIKCDFTKDNPRCNKEKCRLYKGVKTEIL